MSDQPLNVGVIGCGNISSIYLENLARFSGTRVAAVADLLPERAQAKAAEFDIPHACGVDDLLGDGSLEVVLNLTIPGAHFDVTRAALQAGRSVYSEKPLATRLDDGQQLVAAARERDVKLGCAPDTFLGAGLQTARKLVDDGAIGQPVAATAFMVCRGHESWHPDPAFYYAVGGGPLFDMGPYYLTALVSLLGPVRRVCGSARISFAERQITSQPKRGQTIRVETPTHIAGVLDFECGVVATLIMSFDVWHTRLPLLELYGADGSLALPDPNTFGGPVLVRRAGDEDWQEQPLVFGYAENSRGLGVADLARAARSGRPVRCSGDVALHVLEIMEALLAAGETETYRTLTTTCERPAPMDPSLPVYTLDG